MGMDIPYDIVNNTIADGSQVDDNYDYIEQYVNAEVITRDGNTAMQAPLLLNGPPPSEANHAATKAYADAIFPIGAMLAYGGENPPGGGTLQWMLCNGASLLRSAYQVLFGVLDVRFGALDGAHFNLPNTSGRFILGVDALIIDDSLTGTVGDVGGTTVPAMPQHQHTAVHNHGTVTSAGRGQVHTHTINHDHVSTLTSLAGLHDHGIPVRDNAVAGNTASLMAASGAGLTGAANTVAEPNHQHTVDIAATTGLVSGNDNVTHTHDVVIPNSTTDTGDVVGVSTATSFRPPFITVSYIIRVR